MEPRPAPLRILVVTNLYPSPAHPAFGSFVGSRVDALRRQGQDVTVAAITDDRVHRRLVRKYLVLGLTALRHALVARLARRPFDVVEAHIAFPTGLLAWPVARLGGARLVLFAHGSDVTVLPWRSRRSARLARWVFSRADLVVANSRYLATEAVRRLGPFRRAVLVASPGIHPATSTAEAAPRDPKRIVFVARLVDGKGVELLVPAMARLRADATEARLTVIGDGALRPRLEAAIVEAGLTDRVELTGALASQDVAGIIRQAAVVAVPSTRPEGLGLVALEGMRGGAIVVATAEGGLAETMQDGVNGVVIPSGDADALASGLARALAIARSAETGEPMRAAGRATAAEHDPDASAEVTLGAYRALAEPASGGRPRSRA